MNKIKTLREQKNMSQHSLANLAGVAQSSIHYIETGQKSPTVKLLEKIAVALNVSIVELLDKKVPLHKQDT